jgi:hypothetical protein
MHRLPFVFLPLCSLFFGACNPAVFEGAEEPTWFASPVSARPPPEFLSTPDLVVGETHEVTVLSEPGQRVWLARSFAGEGAGPCPAFLGGACMGLLEPIHLHGVTDADADGIARFNFTVPAGTPPDLAVALQALAAGDPVPEISEPVTLITASGECGIVGGTNLDMPLDDGWSTGEGILAWRYTAPDDVNVDRVEVLTGEGVAASHMGIWSHNPDLDQPGVEMSGGDFVIDPVNDWQGADLDVTVPMVAGETYWIAWTLPSGVQFSRTEGGETVSYKNTFDDGETWGGPYENTDAFRLLSCL